MSSDYNHTIAAHLQRIAIALEMLVDVMTPPPEPDPTDYDLDIKEPATLGTTARQIRTAGRHPSA